MKKIYFFIGTTAELIKIAPIIKELQKRQKNFKLISSGQRNILFDDLKDYIGTLKPDIKLAERGNKPSLLFFVAWAIKALLDGLCSLNREFKGLNKNNSFFIIHGDTVSSLIGALIAKIYGLKLVHIESGDRSFNYLEPFPEEIIRFINVHLSDVLFAPNEWAMNNLNGVSGKKVNSLHNTLVETFQWVTEREKGKIDIKQFNNYYLLLLHRQEHVVFRKDWSKKVLEFIIENADKNLNCLLINHPLTMKIISSLSTKALYKKRVTIVPPLSYSDFMKLLKNAEFIATDSDFNQLESYLLGIPYLGLKKSVDQIEGINQNVVISKGDPEIMRKFLDSYKKYETKPVKISFKPSKIIVDFLLSE